MDESFVAEIQLPWPRRWQVWRACLLGYPPPPPILSVYATLGRKYTPVPQPNGAKGAKPVSANGALGRNVGWDGFCFFSLRHVFSLRHTSITINPAQQSWDRVELWMNKRTSELNEIERTAKQIDKINNEIWITHELIILNKYLIACVKSHISKIVL